MFKLPLYLLLIICFSAKGQTVLKVHSSDSSVYKGLVKPLQEPTQYKAELQALQSDFLDQGYLTCNIDSLDADSDTVHAFFFVGFQYKLAQLKNQNVDEGILASSGFRERIYLNKPFNLKQVKQLYERIIQGYEQNGFPFARLRMEIDSVQEDRINARLIVSPHKLFEIDSIYLKSESPISRKYITNAIRIAQGDPYNQLLLDAISTRIKEIPFVSEVRPAEMVFKDGKADLYLYLKKKIANRFNGVVGFLPDDNTGKVTITGELQLDLVNAFNAGEELHIKWRKLQTFTQELKVDGQYPFIFGLPIGIGASLNLYKRDSTYIEVSPKLELQYKLEGRNHFSFFFNQYQSNILNPDLFANSTTLPSFNDASRTMFGVQIYLQNLDYLINPRMGYFVDVSASTGSKRIKKLEALDEQLYDGVNLRTSQHQVEGTIGYYLPLFGRTTLFTSVKGSWLINENVFVNEMNRLGGIQTLRGFDDQSILASAFAIGTMEYRFLLEQNSYLYAFMDYGYYENKSPEGLIHNTPMGIGAGISFETRPGIFTINYALGKLKDTVFLFRAGKIHFGFVNYF